MCFDTRWAQLPVLLLFVDLKSCDGSGGKLWQALCERKGVENNEMGGVGQSAVFKLRSSSAQRGRFVSNGPVVVVVSGGGGGSSFVFFLSC